MVSKAPHQAGPFIACNLIFGSFMTFYNIIFCTLHLFINFKMVEKNYFCSPT